MKIGNTELKYGLCLAPMAGFSDRAMRLVCKKYGAEYSVTEMISAKAVTFNDKKTNSLARIGKDEGAVALQIFGSEPQVMARAAEMLESGVDGYASPVAIDINMGCPVHKIFSNGEGSALMKDPANIERITAAVVCAVKLPVTVKLRAGIDRDSINAVDCALAAESGGAQAVCVHGRTRVQMYSGEVCTEVIRRVKRAVKIPVIANGDITDVKSYERMLSDTGADAVAIGRGAVGNPFLFSEIIAARCGRDYTPPTLRERVDCALYQLRESILSVGEEIAVREARKQIALYVKSFRGASAVRGAVNSALTYKEIEDILTSVLAEEQ